MAAKPKAGGLGRGLGALFADYSVSDMEKNVNKKEKSSATAGSSKDAAKQAENANQKAVSK